ncbi:hypothetical protein [Sabulicella glaciei]|uniref:Invasion associated locus B family protein n=1 Tax=Sabulicella glaciei TaxID=2984948 RepID=A0ABT3NYD6_9PROT|nr:hypothetical protein [Roseococcus sp. MDT2-1-1]MCW8087180.1 hypothetical protein [Roseococcus sp. MDT2-1-1]
MTPLRTLALLALLATPALAQPQGEEIGSWRLHCFNDRMTDRVACSMRHRDWVERPGAQPGLALEVVERNGRLVPAVTARDLSLDGAARGLLALTGTAQLRFDTNPMMELPCGLEGRSLICAPRSADAPRAAEELAGAARALIRMGGMGSGATPGAEPAELRLANTAQALERFRRQQPPGSAPPAPEPGLDLRDILLRLRSFFL